MNTTWWFNTPQKPISFYYKKNIRDKINPKKLSITDDMIDGIVGMLNSERTDDVNVGIKLLKRSNGNKQYDIIIDKMISSKVWEGRRFYLQRNLL